MTDTAPATPPYGQLLTGYGFIRLTACDGHGPSMFGPALFIRPSEIKSLRTGIVCNSEPEETYTYVVTPNEIYSVKEDIGEIFNLIALLDSPGSEAA